MIRTVLIFIAMLLLIAGCGKSTQTTTDASTVISTPPPAYNCYSDTPVNGYGDCYGGSVYFVKAPYVTDGIWSVYTQSNTNRTDGTVFYDRYQYGFDFFSDGSAGKQQQTDGYNLFREWGINDAGTSLTLSVEGTYTYSSTFYNDPQCFQVANNGQQLRLCHESFVVQDFNNSAGYYGPDVTFGNRTNYNFLVAGTWSFAGYGDNTTPSVDILFNPDGNSFESPSGNALGEWGVSLDGKVIGFDNKRYLVYQYIEPQCIAVFELSSDVATSTKWKLCKVN